MRILHLVATNQRRGAEVFAADLVRALGDGGLEQRVVALRGNGGDGTAFAPAPEVLGDGGWSLPGLGVEARGLGRLRRMVREWGPAVIQAHGGEPLKYAVLGAGGRAPIVYRRIGGTPPTSARGPRRAAYAALMRRSSRVAAVADAVRRETIRVFRISPDRVVTIPNGADPARIRPGRGRDETRRRLGIPPDASMVLSVGALTWEKDPLGQVRSAERFLAGRPRARFVMAGDGPLLDAARDLIAGRGLGRSVRLVGVRADIGDVLAAGDVLLLASRSEGMPAIAIEAGMAGLPVVAYRLGGIPEVVEDGVTGRVVPAGDAAGLAAAVGGLLDDEAVRRSLGAAAKERCLTRFDIRRIAHGYLDLYRDVTGGR